MQEMNDEWQLLTDNGELASGDGLSHLVDGDTRVLALVLREHLHHDESALPLALVNVDLKVRVGLDLNAVLVPGNPRGGTADEANSQLDSVTVMYVPGLQESGEVRRDGLLSLRGLCGLLRSFFFRLRGLCRLRGGFLHGLHLLLFLHLFTLDLHFSAVDGCKREEFKDIMQNLQLTEKVATMKKKERKGNPNRNLENTAGDRSIRQQNSSSIGF